MFGWATVQDPTYPMTWTRKTTRVQHVWMLWGSCVFFLHSKTWILSNLQDTFHPCGNIRGEERVGSNNKGTVLNFGWSEMELPHGLDRSVSNVATLMFFSVISHIWSIYDPYMWIWSVLWFPSMTLLLRPFYEEPSPLIGSSKWYGLSPCLARLCSFHNSWNGPRFRLFVLCSVFKYECVEVSNENLLFQRQP